MAIPAIVQGAVAAGSKYSPAIMAQARSLLAKATGNKAVSLDALPKYVGNSPERLSVVTGALVRAGFRPDDLVPADLAGTNAALMQVRETLLRTAGQMQQTYDLGSDRTLNNDVEGDVIRKKRVQVALRVYGSEEAYFLCHPTGGIPRADFAWYNAVIKPR